tara:strand:- start:402 stop:947 length:546 start_codon:yes stop_codon:yes gene_type:complete
MEDQNLNIESNESEDQTINIESNDKVENSADNSSVALETEDRVENKTIEKKEEIKTMNEPEYVYSLIGSAIPNKDGFRKNISQRDFALWVLPIVAINTIRRFTSRKTEEIIQPYDNTNKENYLIKGTETVYTSTKNVFEGNEKMRFFGFRFMSIWVFPMAITGAFMEFLFVGPLKGTNPFG